VTASPLGRYDDRQTDEQLHQVRLLDLPVRLMVAAREHHDELMREFGLLALSQQDDAAGVPTRLVELTQILGVRYGGARARPEEETEAAIAAGIDTIDLTYLVPADVVDAADTLEGLMSEADAFCESEQLLTLARSALHQEFARWYLEEFRRQVAGQPPTPWSGPLDPDD
jgi:hypothetical protein